MSTNNSDKSTSLNTAKKVTFLQKHKKTIMFLAFPFWIGFAVLYSMQPNAKEYYPVGVITKQQLLDNYDGFANNYSDYQLSEEEITAIKAVADKVTINVFFGTWCHDSEREVPRLLQSLKNSQVKVSLIALDDNKSDPEGLAKQSAIKYTPTFIIYASGVEIGRIIERPEQSLAEDILAIWYKHTVSGS